ncbi:MAG TPA: glycerol-3-phosphate dehydrogenase/oxidase [Gemmatimonadaceae bacterium]|nr:glycerol-3-phosphate dehydrogenase/oxidase [Gemmatimonadaceae bacterium]
MQRSFAALESRVFDVLVIGGGITGAGIARDAAMRGMSVAIVEKEDWASGTSSRSSRLIHGGIRYLEHGQIGMVRESVREREILLRIAPHLVKPLEFTWPVYRGARLPKWKLRIGLAIYDFLAGQSGIERHRPIDAEGVLEAEPHLRKDGLAGGAIYYDAATDDAGLTVANMVSAVQNGALAVNYARVESVTRKGAKSGGAIVRDQESEATARVAAHSVVSATGPWQVKGTKGSHIVLDTKRVGNRGAVTMISPDDGRVMFTLPSGDRTIIGTTDIFTDESPDDVRASEGEIAYLLNAANRYFPSADLTTDDVLDTWAGIRPLAASKPGRNPSSISREHSIVRDSSGTIVVTGGKLTTYRSMAAQVVDEIQRGLRTRVTPCTTDSVMLPVGGG